MKLRERWPLYVKWVIVWLVILPMILNRSGCMAQASPRGSVRCRLALSLAYAYHWLMKCFCSSARPIKDRGFIRPAS